MSDRCMPPLNRNITLVDMSNNRITGPELPEFSDFNASLYACWESSLENMLLFRDSCLSVLSKAWAAELISLF